MTNFKNGGDHQIQNGRSNQRNFVTKPNIFETFIA